MMESPCGRIPPPPKAVPLPLGSLQANFKEFCEFFAREAYISCIKGIGSQQKNIKGEKK